MSSGLLRGVAGSRPLLARSALSSSVVLLAASLVGCDSFSAPGDYDHEVAPSGGGVAGGAATGGAPTAGVTPTAGTLGSIALPAPEPPCQIVESAAPVFLARAVSHDAPARRELFAWTTAEQAQELRAGSVLMTRSEREGLGPGYAMEVLAALGMQDPTASAQADSIALAALLSSPAFAKARYAWSEPWATRVGWPGETYGDQLVRMVLRKEAWLARYRSGNIDVVDMDNLPVPTADVLAHPERLAGVYFVRDARAGGPECYGSFRGGGDDGYREFIIGNEAMIEEWSLGTAAIRARIEADIALVQTFFERIRPCPVRTDPHYWNTNVVCGWGSAAAVSELDAYEHSLAIPSPGYVPAAQPLVALIEALQSSLFEPDPFVVTPQAAP
jgi:hypothetical protein